MEEGFSSVVRLSNVSDFIAPNLDCIIPLETKRIEKKNEEKLVNIRKKEKNEKIDKKESIKISLADCLACNGCITSAETVLIEEQSLNRVWEGIEKSQLSVITISPQAICSIAAKLKIEPGQVAKIVSKYFLFKGATHVIDSSFARKFSYSLLYDELSTIPSTSRPLLSSACPGFVCYAEKSHGNLLIPRISRIRSPQAITGALIKDFLSKKYQIEPCQIFHATIMPCFDKKLEASREQFNIPNTEIRETDCVLSTAELFEEIKHFDMKNIEIKEQNGWLGNLSRGNLIGENGGSSGGYAESIIQQHLNKHGGNVKKSKLNKDMETIEIIGNDDKICLRVAKVYGFRNIQNLVRKMKMNKNQYDYVEIMACPGGCGNGGGQIRYNTINEREEQLKIVDKLYNELPRQNSVEFIEIANEWESLNSEWKQLLFTDYKAVETNISQNLKW